MREDNEYDYYWKYNKDGQGVDRLYEPKQFEKPKPFEETGLFAAILGEVAKVRIYSGSEGYVTVCDNHAEVFGTGRTITDALRSLANSLDAFWADGQT